MEWMEGKWGMKANFRPWCLGVIGPRYKQRTSGIWEGFSGTQGGHMVLFIVSEGRTVCFSQGSQILYFKGQLYRPFLG